MEKILIDTDIVIDFLRGYELRTKLFFSKINIQEIKGCISLISIIELNAEIEEENNQQEIDLKKLLSFLEILPVDFDLGKRAGLLRKKNNLSIADSIVAATSIRFKIRLFTFNTKHFIRVPELSLYSSK